MPTCSNSVTFKIDFDFAAAAIAATVVGVFDRYDNKLSIKSAERDRRSSSFGDHKVFQLIDGRPIPDWKKFLRVNANKHLYLET
jgi:hypothetical protein